MFRDMRVKEALLEKKEAETMLENGSYAVLSVTGDDNYSYAVPVNYVYEQGKVYFHCADEGHKVDALKSNPKVSVCVVAKDDVIPEDFNTMYKSVIAFGEASFVEDATEKKTALVKLLEKYSPNHIDSGMKYLDAYINDCIVIAIDILHITGKTGT